jgi:hypothetical protein
MNQSNYTWKKEKADVNVITSRLVLFFTNKILRSSSKRNSLVQEIWTDTKRFWIFFNSHWNIKKETRRKMFIWDCSIMLQVTVSAHFNGCYWDWKTLFLERRVIVILMRRFVPPSIFGFRWWKLRGRMLKKEQKIIEDFFKTILQ